MTTTLTLADIRKHSPCADGWSTLLRSLGYADGQHDPARVVSIGDVARSNGVGDALWCLQCLPNTIETRRLTVRMVIPALRRAAVHTTDQRVHDCIAALDRWQAGDDSVDLAAAAYAAARAAAWAAASAADAAAWAAVWAARADRAAAVVWAAAWAARAARAAVWAADAAAVERARQVEDIIAVSPIHALAEETKP